MDDSAQIGDANAERPSNGQLPTPYTSPVLKHQDSDADTPVSTSPVGFSDDAEKGEALQRIRLHKESEIHDLPTVETVLDTPAHETNSSPGVSRKRSIGKTGSPIQGSADGEKVLKLSPARMQELMSSPQSLPLRSSPIIEEEQYDLDLPSKASSQVYSPKSHVVGTPSSHISPQGAQSSPKDVPRPANVRDAPNLASVKLTPGASSSPRPSMSSRAISTPQFRRRQSSSKQAPSGGDQSKPQHTPPAPLKLESERTRNLSGSASLRPSPIPDTDASPMPPSLPLPPLSIPAYLQLELSSERPSPLYIYRSSTIDTPYESSRVKFERLMNFLLLPPELERVLVFGTLACLDAFLHTFTILPLRFLKAVGIVFQWLIQNLIREVAEIGTYIRHGLGRMWRQWRRNITVGDMSVQITAGKDEDYASPSDPNTSKQRTASSRENAHVAAEIRRFVKGHRRTRSTPSALLPEHKADILKGLLVLLSCFLLNSFDASRMYHSIRGQAAIKLYVIYNVLEVGSLQRLLWP